LSLVVSIWPTTSTRGRESTVANGSGLSAEIETLYDQQDLLGDALVRYPEGPALEDLAPLPVGGG
jgi:hypothetical protein